MCVNCNSKTWDGVLYGFGHIVGIPAEQILIDKKLYTGGTMFFQPKDGDITMNGNGESLIYRNYEWHKYS